MERKTQPISNRCSQSPRLKVTIRGTAPGGVSVYIQNFSDRLVPEFQAVEAPTVWTDAEPLTQFQRYGWLDVEIIEQRESSKLSTSGPWYSVIQRPCSPSSLSAKARISIARSSRSSRLVWCTIFRERQFGALPSEPWRSARARL